MSNLTNQALKKLREPFTGDKVSKLPKSTRQQAEIIKNDHRLGIRCQECGQWHHPDAAHLDYVGHAAITDRLLDVDPTWTWEPLAVDERGLPLYDQIGGMWIRLTVCGMTRIGYGHAGSKKGGDAIKEIIGDALRNAAMRFGAALDLWHKGELHSDDDHAQEQQAVQVQQTEQAPTKEQIEQEKVYQKQVQDFMTLAKKNLDAAQNEKELKPIFGMAYRNAKQHGQAVMDAVEEYYKTRKEQIK